MMSPEQWQKLYYDSRAAFYSLSTPVDEYRSDEMELAMMGTALEVTRRAI
jgi:hypothetical protein